MDKQEIVESWVGSKWHVRSSSEHFAPSNIALCKYWGKRDPKLNLPVNSSLSVSLDHLGSRTQVSPSDQSYDQVLLNGVELHASSKFASKVSAFIDLFRQGREQSFRVETRNNIPTAAGLASSASGFAALTFALNDALNLELSKEQLSILARIGSGSASRSIFTGFVQWNRGVRDDGMDSFAYQLTETWPGLAVGLIKVDLEEKAVDSRAGMIRTAETSDLYPSWSAQAESDLNEIHRAINQRDFELLGQTAEKNALSMHATMISSWPPLLYWQPESVEMMHRIWALRRQGTEVFFTMDAGPNIKLLFQDKDQGVLLSHFPDLEILLPFGVGG